jgi:hypothetical protein
VTGVGEEAGAREDEREVPPRGDRVEVEREAGREGELVRARGGLGKDDEARVGEAGREVGREVRRPRRSGLKRAAEDVMAMLSPRLRGVEGAAV